MRRIIIAAVAKNGVIGKSDNTMPWHISEEFKHFKNTTIGYVLIMGRRTFESLGKPLKKRLNIVITRKKDYQPPFENVYVVNSLESAIEYCRQGTYEKVFISGGAEIYRQALAKGYVDEMILSHLDFDAQGDVFFPDFEPSDWKIGSREKREQFEIVWYEKKR